MKTHFYILLMLGMVFLLGCEDEKLGTDLGVTNVVLPDISEESLGTEITIQGNGFIDCDVLALSPLSGGTEQPIYMETREVQSDHITVLYPSTATKDSYGLVLVRGSKMRTLGVINSTVGVMPDENLRNALSALFPDIFKGEKISSSAKYVTFTDGTLNISDKNITSLEGLEYFSNIRKLICNNNDISEIPAEVLSRLSELTAQNTGLTKLELATSEQPNTTLVSLNIDGSTKLESVDLYYCYNIEKFSALNCKLVYLDVRNYHSIYGGCLNYNSTDFKFTFSDDASKERLPENGILVDGLILQQ
ncbi:protein phosphatase 1 regulatory subunit 42 [Bacteroides ovatus]|nr:protein phosphatase 1 regulatory subunit 42 [Bacteroides ovatus]